MNNVQIIHKTSKKVEHEANSRHFYKIRIGITGSTGVLGQRLTELFVQRGFYVNCLVRKTSNNIDKLKKYGVNIFYGDICDYFSLIDFVKEIDVCIHLAAQVGYGTKKQYKKINIGGTDNICKAILTYNPECRLIYCSTIAALKIKKIFKIMNTNYAISKYYAEELVTCYIQKEGLKGTIIYPGLIYGPYDINFMPAIIKNLKQKKFFLISGGEKNAPLIYIDDLCELFFLASIKEEAIDKKYIGIGDLDLGIHGFIKMVADRLGYPIPRVVFPKMLILPIAVLMESLYGLLSIKTPPFISKRVVDVLSGSFKQNNNKDQNNLGWKPMCCVTEGIDYALKWYFEQFEQNTSA
jgi:nucleoside-diphosphate-sugar epimerase